MFDYFFWFSQPSTILSLADKNLGYIFGALTLIGVVLKLVQRFLTKDPITKKLLMNLAQLTFSSGISGVIWFSFRYENTPVFGRRYWAGLVLLIAIVWLIFILKYLIFRYGKEKMLLTKEAIRNKYLPKSK